MGSKSEIWQDAELYKNFAFSDWGEKVICSLLFFTAGSVLVASGRSPKPRFWLFTFCTITTSQLSFQRKQMENQQEELNISWGHLCALRLRVCTPTRMQHHKNGAQKVSPPPRVPRGKRLGVAPEALRQTSGNPPVCLDEIQLTFIPPKVHKISSYFTLRPEIFVRNSLRVQR